MDTIEDNESVYTPDTINNLEHPEKEEWIDTYMKDDDTYRILTFNDIFNDELIDNSDKYIDWVLNFTLCDPSHFTEIHEDIRPPPKPPDNTIYTNIDMQLTVSNANLFDLLC